MVDDAKVDLTIMAIAKQFIRAVSFVAACNTDMLICFTPLHIQKQTRPITHLLKEMLTGNYNFADSRSVC